MLVALLFTIVSFSAQAAQPESGWYKIQNVGTQKYVSVKGRYYAKPDASVDDATVIYLGIGERIPSRYEQYKLTSLKGNNIEVYDYLDKAVTLANAYVDNVMTQGSNALTPEEVAYAHQLIEQYKNEYGYLYIENGNGAQLLSETTWMLGVTIPAIPEEVEQKALEHGVTDGVWNWAKRVVYKYIANNPGMDQTLKALVEAYLEQIEPGNTYYLSAEDNDTFGFVNDNDLTNAPVYQWKLETYTPEPGISGYYRIKNANGVDGKQYVNVTGKFEANPNLTKEDAVVEAGTVHYIGLGERVGNLAQEVTRLSAQGRNVNRLAELGIAKVKELGCSFVDKIVESDPTFADYADNAKEMINNYEVNKTVNVLNTITSSGEDAYYCLYTTPSMETLSNAVSLIFSMGKGQGWAANHPYWFNFDEETGKAVSLKEDAFLASAKDSIKAELVILGYADKYPELYQKLLNNIDRIKPATTYYLIQDPDATFGYIEADELDAKGDAAKWILEPVDEENYFAIKPSIEYTKPDVGTCYYTTLYTDFAYTMPEGVKAYKIAGIEEKVSSQGKKYYVCTKTELTGQVPAFTPVVIETPSNAAADNKFLPTGTPVEMGGIHMNLTEPTSDNLLVASFFDEESDGNNRELSSSPVGFYGATDMINGNEAYLDASKLTPSNATVYYLFDDENIPTAIESVDAGKSIASVKYVNLAGVESSTPFSGMNIVVVTYGDGTKSTNKEVK